MVVFRDLFIRSTIKEVKMITLGNRRYGNPILLTSDGSIVEGKRIHFHERGYDEKWLQELIRKNPDLLPIPVEIADLFSPLIPIGKEVQTKVGPIDNLFISPRGYLTVVETKLWRNPEAHREVVGQIIDYAKEISQWSYDELDAQVRAYNQKYTTSNIGLLDTFRTKENEPIDEADKPDIMDAITRNLKNSKFLLLIVGDRIRKNVETMADFLNQPQLNFSFSLVEIQLYEINSDLGKLTFIVPQTVIRTREITRAVIHFEGKTDGITIAPPDGGDDTFFENLAKKVGVELKKFALKIIDDMENLGCRAVWKRSSYVIKFPDPTGSGDLFTLFVVDVNGWVYTYSGWLAGQLQRVFASPETNAIAMEFLEKFTELPQSPSRIQKNKGKLLPGSPGDLGASLGEVHKNYDQLLTTVKSAIEKIRELAEK